MNQQMQRLHQGGDPEGQRRKGIGCLVVLAVLVAAVWIVIEVFGGDDVGDSFYNDETSAYASSSSYNGPPLPTLTSAESQRLAQGLAQAEQNYGVCFGWRLTDGAGGKVQVGSSRGAGVAADTCPRSAEVRIVVAYTSDSDASEDAAGIEVRANLDRPGASSIRQRDFAALGITASALVDDPVSVTGHAALALPLLLVEHGALPPTDPGPQQQTPPGTPLPAAESSGFPGSIVLLVVLGLAALTAFGVGIWGPGRKDKEDEGDGPSRFGPPGPPGPPRTGAGNPMPQSPMPRNQPGPTQFGHPWSGQSPPGMRQPGPHGNAPPPPGPRPPGPPPQTGPGGRDRPDTPPPSPH